MFWSLRNRAGGELSEIGLMAYAVIIDHEHPPRPMTLQRLGGRLNRAGCHEIIRLSIRLVQVESGNAHTSAENNRIACLIETGIGMGKTEHITKQSIEVRE